MTKKEILESDRLTDAEKMNLLEAVRAYYRTMSDEHLLQLVRDFVAEHGRTPTRSDLAYDTVLKDRFGPWNRMLEKAGVRPKRIQQAEKK